jgi:lipopolysaccharide/colanic/teichoic acid biosynthesis glycosyltransferase
MRYIRGRQLLRHADECSAPEQMRRLTDSVIACVLLAITGPLLLLVVLALKLEGPGPVLVGENCIGIGGRRFRLLRFRTLRHDPDRTLPNWRRPTAIGKILRSTRIEALPQLINVVRGEMSIVDPDGRSPSFLD